MAGIFQQAGGKIKDTARGALYAAAGPDLLQAYGMASSLGRTVADTAKEISAAASKATTTNKKQTDTTKELVEVQKEQTDVIGETRDVLKDIASTNKKIQRQEKINKDKEKFAEIEARLETKTSVTATAVSKIKEAGGLLNHPLVKLLMGIFGGAIAWNTLFTEDERKAISDKAVAFVEGVLGLDQGRIQEWVRSLSTFTDGIAAAAAGLFFLGKIAAMSSRPPSTTGGTGPIRPPTRPGATTGAGPTGATTGANRPGAATPPVGAGAGAAASTAGRATPTTPPGTSTTTPRTGVPRVNTGAPPGATWDASSNRWRDSTTGRFVRGLPPVAAVAEAAAKRGALSTIGAALKNVPLFGAGIAGIESAIRYFGADDPEGAALAAAQIAGAIPTGVTNAAAIAAAATLLAFDLFQIFHPEGKRPSLRGVSDDRYVNINDDPFARSLFAMMQEQALKAVGVGTSAQDFATMSRQEQEAFVRESSTGIALEGMVQRGEISASEYEAAIQSYTDAVASGAGQATAMGDRAAGQSIYSITGNVQQNNATNEYEFVGSAAVHSSADDYMSEGMTVAP